jgi:membrane-bound metal-dependent hydrolase YbcI (DUF457 family)
MKRNKQRRLIVAQAGMHSIVGMAVRKWTPAREWLILGIVLGNLLPDTDNLAVAVATVTGGSTAGLHRTFTHSLFTIVAIIILFQLILFLIFLPLVYVMESGFMTIYGTAYLLSLIVAAVITLQMRQTIENLALHPTRQPL